MSGIGEHFIETSRLINDFGIVNYVETGVERGVALNWVREHGGRIRRYDACDLNKAHADAAKVNFPYASIYHGDSISFLASLLPEIAGPTLFWLDAHFPGNYGDPQDTSNWFPALNEMRTIKALKRDYEHDVILVDDVGGFVGGSTFPIGDKMFSLNTDELLSVFADTHYCEILPFNTSVLRCVPK